MEHVCVLSVKSCHLDLLLSFGYCATMYGLVNSPYMTGRDIQYEEFRLGYHCFEGNSAFPTVP